MGTKFGLGVIVFLCLGLIVACGGPPSPAQPTATPLRAKPTHTSAPIPTVPAAPSAILGTAMQWYPMAEKEALAWQSDAVLYSVVGGNIARDGSSLPCDGLAEQWNYIFVSISAQKRLSLFVADGQLTSTRLENPLSSTGPVDQKTIDYFSNLYPASEWKVDSPQAAQIANNLFKQKYDVEPRQISYVMFNTKYMDFIEGTMTNWMSWVISYDPERYPFQVTMDARTGEVKERP